MSVFATYDDVELIADPDGDPHFHTDVPTEDLVISSGGLTTPYAAHVRIDKAVPDTYTFELTFQIVDMPVDFTDVPSRHIFAGVVNGQGCCSGLFFASAGITYTGSVVFGHGFGGYGLGLNTPMQLLPDSIGKVLPGVYYTIRIAVDPNTRTTFIYITETALLPVIGHQLLYILPALLSDDGFVNPGDETIVSVCGQVSAPSVMQLNSVCLGNGLLIPNLPPVADAGKDQSTRTCSIIRLDGRASFDPEGAPLVYKWRLTDGPEGSVYAFAGHDGDTHGGLLTNKFYSADLEAYNTVTPVMRGDVLLVDAVPYDILSQGSDGYGFYVQIDGFDLDGSLAGENFKLLRQNSLAGSTSGRPTFYPDVPGVFRFDLVVFDGGLHSPPTNVVVSVVDSHVPRGITPDLSFIWNYLSDFYRLVGNTESIDVFWGAVAQVAASELLTLWQHEYSKSLRDVQRTFQRRWLHYDLFIQEPLIEQTSTRVLYAGVETVDIPLAGISGVEGTLELSAPLLGDTTIFLSPEDPSAFLPEDIQAQLRRQLKDFNGAFEVELHDDALSPLARVVVTAPFPFTFTAASTSTGLFPAGATNDIPRGTDGLVLATNTYRVERSLLSAGIQEGDFLAVDGVSYRITRVVSNAADPYAAQRIITSENLPLSMGRTWAIVGATKSAFLDFYNALISAGDVAVFELVDLSTQALAYVPVIVLSATTDGRLLTESAAFAAFHAQPGKFAVYFHSVYRRTYMPVDDLVVEVPTLQEVIQNVDDSSVLRQNIDFFREEYRGHACLRFVTASSPGDPDVWQLELPSKRLWAEVSYIDNRPVIEQNFGILAEFTLDDLSLLPSNADYLSIVRGLWYSYFNGPTLRNLRVGTQILLGLPFAEETGTIVEVRPDFSVNQGRILVKDNTDPALVRAYAYPRSLPLEVNPSTGEAYKVGDVVEQFTPLVTGAEVVDYIKDPKWFRGYLEQGSFYEIEKFFKFLVRVDSSVFSLSTLAFVRSFILRIKPTYTFPMFVVKKQLPQTTVNTTDARRYNARLIVNTFPHNYEERGLGGTDVTKVGGAFDDPRSAGGGWWSKFDGDYPLAAAPTYPTARRPIRWGYDRTYLCPEDVIFGKLTTTWAGGTPTFDSLLAWDQPVMLDSVGSIRAGASSILSFLVPPKKLQVGTDLVVAQDFSMNACVFQYRTMGRGGDALPLAYEVNVFSDDTLTTLVHTFTGTVTIPAGADAYLVALPIPGGPLAVTAGQVAQVFVYSGDLLPVNPPAPARVYFHFGQGTPWSYDASLTADSYQKVRGI